MALTLTESMAVIERLVGEDEGGREAMSTLASAYNDAVAEAAAGAFALPAPLPVRVYDEYPGIALAVCRQKALVVTRDGASSWEELRAVRFLFPPDGPHRLLFGWAEKGWS